MNRRRWLALSAASLAAALPRWQLALGADAMLGPDPKLWNDTVDKAIKYLRSTQAADGSWSRDVNKSAASGPNLGVTGIVVTGLLQTGKLGADDPMVAKALKFIESLVNVKAGHIAGQDPKPQLLNYVTCVNVMALKAAGRDEKYKKIIGNAADFLKKLQWDEQNDKKPEDDFYGGAGYDSKSRPDLSNTQFFLEALKEAGIPESDPAFQHAKIFVTRCQNLKGEGNDQPWAGKVNDGSFIYSAAAGGQTKALDKPEPDGSLPGYGSMTYAGIKSLIYCGVSKSDPRIKKALEWTEKHYTLDFNPGMPKVRQHQGLYYYYHSMAKCLEVLDVKKLKAADGKEHDWRAEITQTLAKQQKDDGSWVNDRDSWMEGDPNLVTGYALMTLSHCKPTKA